MSKPKRPRKSDESGASPGFNIPPEARKMFEDAVRQHQAKEGFASDDQETVSKFAYDQMVKEYKAKLEKANADKEKFKTENAQLRKDKTAAEKRAQKLDVQVSDLNSKLDKAKNDLKSAKDEIKNLNDTLKKRPVETVVMSDDSEIKKLTKKLEKAEKDIDALESERDGLNDAIDEKGQEIENLKARTAELEGQLESLKEDEEETSGTITWETATRFTSDLFTEKRYKVMIARTGEYMSFTPDIEGKAICIDKSIDIPIMANYLDFEKRTFDVHQKGSTMVIFF